MTTVTATEQGQRTGLDIGWALRQGWRLFVDDLGPFLLAGLITVVLGTLTLGVLAGPLVAGLFDMVVVRLREGRHPAIGDVFNQFDRFWSFLGATLVLAILIGLAMLTIVGGFLLATIWLYVFPIMVERNVGLGEAMKESKAMVLANGFWEHLALVIILAIVTSVANGVFAIIAVPFSVVVVAASYYLAAGRAEELERL